MNGRNISLAIVFLMITTITWGGMFPVAKHALSTIDAFYMTSIRYGVASLIFIILLYAVEGKKSFDIKGKALQLYIFGSLGFAGFSLLAFDGLRYSSSVHAAIIMAMMPVITVLLNWFINGKKPAPVTLLFIIFAFSGVFLVVSKGDWTSIFNSSVGFGDLMILAGAFCWVRYSMSATSFNGWSPLRFTTLSCALGTISIFICTILANLTGYIVTPEFQTISNVSWELSYLIVLAAVIAVLSWNKGLKMLGPINGILFINLVPITAFIISALQGAQFNDYEIFGATLTLLSLVANNVYMRIESAKLAVKAA